MFDDADEGRLSLNDLTEVVTELGDTLSKSELDNMLRQARPVLFVHLYYDYIHDYTYAIISIVTDCGFKEWIWLIDR